MAIKIYTKQYAGLLQEVFKTKQHFLRTFGGKLQVKDGISNKDTFLELKISDTDVTVQSYSTDANVAFGTGTGSSNRFGSRKEIVSVDKQVKYEAPLAIHEGVDNFTVNDSAEQVVGERAALHAEAWTEQLNALLGKALSDNASETLTGELTEAGITKVFSEAYKTFINNKVSKDIAWVAYVNADVYDFLVEHKLTTTGKRSSANIDKQEIREFKGFILEVLADEYFQTGEQVMFAADNVGVVGVGIEVYRLLDSEDFAGIAIQAAAKYGKYVPEKNKKAILKAKLTDETLESSAKPVINPVKVGDTAITGTGGVSGATLEVELPDKTKLTATIAGDGTWTVDIPAEKPVAKDDVIKATQTETGKASTNADEVTVTDPEA